MSSSIAVLSLAGDPMVIAILVLLALELIIGCRELAAGTEPDSIILIDPRRGTVEVFDDQAALDRRFARERRRLTQQRALSGFTENIGPATRYRVAPRPRERRGGRRRTSSRAGPDSDDPEPARRRQPHDPISRNHFRLIAGSAVQ